MAEKIAKIGELDKIHADFGNYPLITDAGFGAFLDALSKFDLKSMTICLGTSEISATTNITDQLTQKLARLLPNLPNLDSFELNLKK